MDNIVIDILNNTDKKYIEYILNNIENNFRCNWTKEQFQTIILSNNYKTYIARKGKLILGFLTVSNLIDNIEILNIVVGINYRRMKIASYLLQNLFDNFPGIPVSLEVNIKNEPAIMLYNSFGFKIISIRKGYYLNKETNTKEDAYIMKN